MSLAFDYSAGRIAPAVLKAAGAAAVFRYVSTPGNPKNIGKAEYAELTAAGIAVGLVFETTATWMLGGYSAGVAAARSARSQATGVGYRADYPIWFAADFDTTVRLGALATVLDCLHGCADAEGSKSLVRAYGDYAVIEAAAGAGFTGGWQTSAWSGGIWSPHALIRQTGKTATEAGVQVDVDEDAGPLFPPDTPAPIAAPAADSEEETMLILAVPKDPKTPSVLDPHRWLLDGGQVVPLETGQDVEGLTAQGVKTATVSRQFVDARLAAAAGTAQ